MAAEHSVNPASTAAQALLESPGMIRQEELKLFYEAANLYLGGHLELEEELQEVKACLEAGFEAGWLIEMGEFEFYRDQTGELVVACGIRESEKN